MEQLFRKVHGKTYVAQQSSELYPTARDTCDWTYGEYDAVSLTVAPRPASAEEGGFIVPSTEIRPCWEENCPAALGFIEHVLERPERGPVVTLPDRTGSAATRSAAAERR